MKMKAGSLAFVLFRRLRKVQSLPSHLADVPVLFQNMNRYGNWSLAMNPEPCWCWVIMCTLTIPRMSNGREITATPEDTHGRSGKNLLPKHPCMRSTMIMILGWMTVCPDQMLINLHGKDPCWQILWTTGITQVWEEEIIIQVVGRLFPWGRCSSSCSIADITETEKRNPC